MTMIAVDPGGGYRELGQPFEVSQVPGTEPAPGGQVGFDVGANIGGVGLEVFGSLAATLGKLGEELRASRSERKRPRIPPEAIAPVHMPSTPIQLTAGAGTLDVPQLYRPTMGRWWDIQILNASGFTAGTVQALYNGFPGDIAFPWPAAGQATFGKGQLLLRGNGERLVFVATGITGIVLVSFRGVAVLDEYLADYLA